MSLKLELGSDPVFVDPSEELAEVLEFVCMNCEGPNLSMKKNLAMRIFSEDFNKFKVIHVDGVQCADCGELYMTSHSAADYIVTKQSLDK